MLTRPAPPRRRPPVRSSPAVRPSPGRSRPRRRTGSRGDGARAAGRLRGVAGAAAVEDQPVRQHRPVALARTGRPTSCSTLTGSSCSVQPKRRASRPKCVSTVMPGTPKALPSTTFAVLRPTPGSVTRSFSRPGTSPSKRSTSAAPEGDERVRLGAEEAGGPDHLLQLGAVGRGVRRGVRVPREQRGRDQVHPDVGGLRRQHGGDQQLEGVLEVELAVGVRVALGQRPVDAAGLTLAAGGGRGDCSHGPSLRATTDAAAPHG